MFEKWKLIYTSAGIAEYAANFFSNKMGIRIFF
jgi:hypothetical protein